MSADPLTCLVEIAAITMDRMNTGTTVSADEAFTLGKIAGVVAQVPEALERLREMEE